MKTHLHVSIYLALCACVYIYHTQTHTHTHVNTCKHLYIYIFYMCIYIYTLYTPRIPYIPYVSMTSKPSHQILVHSAVDVAYTVHALMILILQDTAMPKLTTLLNPDNVETQAWDMDLGLLDGPVLLDEACLHYIVDPARVK